MCVFGIFDDLGVFVIYDGDVGVGGFKVDINYFSYVYFFFEVSCWDLVRYFLVVFNGIIFVYCSLNCGDVGYIRSDFLFCKVDLFCKL